MFVHPTSMAKSSLSVYMRKTLGRLGHSKTTKPHSEPGTENRNDSTSPIH